ncbi:MAG: PEP-CTERM sorting domain-containing protein [Planctomycetota bacterium]
MIQSLKSAKTATLLAGAVAGAAFCLPAAAATVNLTGVDVRQGGVFGAPFGVTGTTASFVTGVDGPAAVASAVITLGGLDLDGDSTANDSVEFTMTWTDTTSPFANARLFNQGADTGFGSLNGLLVEVAVTPGQTTTDTGDIIVFDGFTGAAIGVGGGGDITRTADINGTEASVSITGAGFSFATTAIDFALTPTVTFDNSGGTGGSIVARNYDLQFSTTAIPEPASMALLGLGGMCLFGRRRRKA